MYKLAKKLGFADELCKNIAVNNDEPNIEDITREFNKRYVDHRLYRPELRSASSSTWRTSIPSTPLP